ncbi:CU044_5270 family protein [Sphaerisporangium fuscum]|uniref:CU044_5270 family protein n=1 Tax=Sphaerisporangium fuscum TaxID=2835868 RepID=UPI001BDD1A1D|nr:CU044_5270 family protein [Sphaerisporangium fuscum]
MDEISAVRDLYGNPPLDPFLQSRVRVRLDQEMGARGEGRRRSPWKAVAAGLAVVAAVATVTVAVPELSARLDASRDTTATASLTGKDVLLRIADQAESTPETTGEYWHVREFGHYTFGKQLGEGANKYWVEASELREHWTTRDGESWVGERKLGVVPKTPADLEAWRRDGSPSQWDRTMEPKLVEHLSLAPDKGALTQMRRGEVSYRPDGKYMVTGGDPKVDFLIAGRELTYAQVRALPEDPAALTAWVRETLGRTTDPSAREYHLAITLSQTLVLDVPAPPKVRAAAYRALAGLPNVRYVGDARDEQGRAGVEFSIVESQDGNVTNLIIDPRTGQVLSAEETVRDKGEPVLGKTRTTTYLEVGWTGVEPQVPDIPAGYPPKLS